MLAMKPAYLTMHNTLCKLAIFISNAAIKLAITGSQGMRDKSSSALGPSRREVAKYLGVSIGTLARWAWLGTGPRYRVVAGRCRYDWRDVAAWVEQQRTGGQVMAE